MKTNETNPKPLAIHCLRRLLLALLLGAALVGPAGLRQAQAITHGTRDGNAHPYVGMVVFYDPAVRVTSWGIDPNCAGPGFGSRTDIAESLDYLGPYLP